MIRIAQAGSSEFGSAWGVPPNQRRTGVTAQKPEGNMDGELNVVKFQGAWEAVFRPVSSIVADKLAWLITQAVKNGSHIGYGQNNGQYPRTGVFDEMARQKEQDPDKISVLVNCDCSSLTGACVFFAGVKDPALRDMNTYTEREILMKTGQFIELRDPELLKSARGIKRGDILWRPGHTAVAIDSDDSSITTPARVWNCVMANLRTGPGTENKIIKALPAGKRVELISTSANGWAQVLVDGECGYISPKYYEIYPTTKATGNVWLRKDAGTNSDGIIVIPKGATVYLTGQSKKVLLTTWYSCSYAGKDGWASGKYIK